MRATNKNNNNNNNNNSNNNNNNNNNSANNNFWAAPARKTCYHEQKQWYCKGPVPGTSLAPAKASHTDFGN